jgi:hypothetical protein
MSPRNSIVILLVLGLAGCADYMNRRDSVTLGAGNALEGNIGLHTIDPFPEVAKDTDINRNGNEIIKRRVAVPAAAPAAAPAAN